MEVHRREFFKDGFLSTVKDAIRNARFVAVDLEFSGVIQGFGPVTGKKPLAKDRYQALKEAAEKFQVLQLGITCVEISQGGTTHTCRPFSFTLNPGVDARLGVDRTFSCQASALQFLANNGFRFDDLFSAGIPYLSHYEERRTISREKEISSKMKDDIMLDDMAISFASQVRAEIQGWIDNPTPDADYINVSLADGNVMNSYMKRVVHQVVRDGFPSLVSVGRSNFVQIMREQDYNSADREVERKKIFDKTLEREIGLRRIFDYLAERCIPIVGHNLFTDLVHLYRTFYGPLPETLSEFCALVHSRHPVVIDTKYLGSGDGTDSANSMTSLQSLWDTFAMLRCPTIEIAPGHPSYPRGTSLHNAGYDSYTTARVLIRYMGYFHTQLGLMGDQTRRSQRRAREKVIEFIRRSGTFATDAHTSVAIPDFDSPLWEPLLNTLQVNGTHEGLIRLMA